MRSSVSAGCYFNEERCSDPLVSDLFEGYLKPGMVVIDCGAHIGEYSVHFSQLVGKEGHVYAFEPDPRPFELLERNIESNHVSNVTLNRIAVDETDGTASFVLRRDAAASSLEAVDSSSSTRTISCRTISLDSYVREHALHRVDALKIDVEGSEVAVLRGARDMIAAFRPGIMVLDCHSNSWQVAEIADLLAEFGYAVEHVSPERKCIQVIVRLKEPIQAHQETKGRQR